MQKPCILAAEPFFYSKFVGAATCSSSGNVVSYTLQNGPYSGIDY